MILSGLAFHRNGFGSVLWSATYLLMAACRSTMPTKVPRLRRRLVSRAKKPSTAFSHEARVASKPGEHLGMFVGGIVVEDDVDGLLGRNRFLDGVEEADELLVAMALHTPADHLTFEHVKGSKQRGGTVTLVVMGHGACAALLHRQAWLGTVQRLGLALLLAGQNHGLG